MEKGNWAQSPIPNQEAVYNLYLMGKGKFIFLWWSGTGYISYTPGQAHTQEWLTNRKQTPCILCVPIFDRIWCLLSFQSWFYWSLGDWEVFERSNTKLSGYREVGKILGEGKNIIEIYCIKKYKIIKKNYSRSPAMPYTKNSK